MSAADAVEQAREAVFAAVESYCLETLERVELLDSLTLPSEAVISRRLREELEDRRQVILALQDASAKIREAHEGAFVTGIGSAVTEFSRGRQT